MAELPDTRVDFSPRTRELVARRAGYRCSLPKCGRSTIGPSALPDQSVSVGIAAHIYSAAAGGPRGRGALTAEELASPANAIWLCANHASLIDKNRGADYPPELLVSYKARREAQAAAEMEGLSNRFGWVEALHVVSSPLFARPTMLEFGKLTLLIGPNGVGKTALCEWLAASTDVRYLQRWQRTKPGRERLEVTIRYADPEPHSLRIDFRSEEFPRYEEDGRTTLIPIAPLKALYPVDLLLSAVGTSNDLERAAALLHMHPYEVAALCDKISRDSTGDVTRIWFEAMSNGLLMRADVRGTRPGLPLGNLSGGERAMMFMKLAEVAANQLAVRYPTVLILDGSAFRLGNDWLKTYGERLSSAEIRFQTIASIPRQNVNLAELRWAGWKVYQLEGEPPNVTVVG